VATLVATDRRDGVELPWGWAWVALVPAASRSKNVCYGAIPSGRRPVAIPDRRQKLLK